MSFTEIYEILCQEMPGPTLFEALTKAEIEKMKDEIATPEILPCTFDATIPGWLERIKMWGKVKIQHKDPENKLFKRNVTVHQFLNKLSDENLNKMLGKWSIKKNSVTKVTFHRDYVGANGKHYTEQFIISVKLRPELKK